MQSLNNLTFVIPIKNEVLNPSIFISFVQLMYKDFELIFVYDDDDERALTELEPLLCNNVRVVKNYGEGVGDAIVSGVEACRTKNVGVICCDDIGPLYYLDIIARELDLNPSSIIGMTRYVKGGARLHGDVIQIAFSKTANKILSILTGVSDLTSAARYGEKETMLQLYDNHDTKGWEVNLVFILRALSRKIPLNEVPVVSVDRLRHGKSSFDLRKWFRLYSKTLIQHFTFKRNCGRVINHRDESNE